MFTTLRINVARAMRFGGCREDCKTLTVNPINRRCNPSNLSTVQVTHNAIRSFNSVDW